MKRLALALAILLTTAPMAFAVNGTVTVKWQTPLYFVTSGDCNAALEPIPTEDLATIQSQVEYQVGTGEVKIETTAAKLFDVVGPAGTTIRARVGSFLPGGQVSCWTDWYSKVIPVPSCGKPTDVTLEIK